MPVITVIIPAYNSGPYLDEAVQAVIAQTFTDWECIVVDDGSTEDLSRVEKMDPRIRLIHQPNAGQAAARNRGLALATGELVAFLDHDDLWPEDHLAWAMQVMRDNPDVDTVGGTFTNNLASVRETVESGQRIRIDSEGIWWGCPFTSVGQVIMRTAAVRAVGGFDADNRGVEDYDLYIRLARCRPILRVPRLALQFREHPGNQSKDLWRMLTAGAQCLHRRLPEVPFRRRWAMSRRAYRGLYDFVGRDILISLRSPRKGLNGKAVKAWCELLRRFGPGLVTDPRLAARFVGDAFSSHHASNST